MQQSHPYRNTISYLLTYFLGQTDKAQQEQVAAYAARHQLEVISLGNPADETRYVAGPTEFLEYYRGATAVVTDSFHGLVFSILFQRPYVVVERAGGTGSGFSRIRTLLNTLSLPERRLEDVDAAELLNLDFSQTEVLLDKERSISLAYLKNALGLAFGAAPTGSKP